MNKLYFSQPGNQEVTTLGGLRCSLHAGLDILQTKSAIIGAEISKHSII